MGGDGLEEGLAIFAKRSPPEQILILANGLTKK